MDEAQPRIFLLILRFYMVDSSVNEINFKRKRNKPQIGNKNTIKNL